MVAAGCVSVANGFALHATKEQATKVGEVLRFGSVHNMLMQVASMTMGLPQQVMQTPRKVGYQHLARDWSNPIAIARCIYRAQELEEELYGEMFTAPALACSFFFDSQDTGSGNRLTDEKTLSVDEKAKMEPICPPIVLATATSTVRGSHSIERYCNLLETRTLRNAL